MPSYSHLLSRRGWQIKDIIFARGEAAAAVVRVLEEKRHMIEVAPSLGGGRFSDDHGLAMARPWALETRAGAIMDRARARSPGRRRGALAALGLILAALALGAAAPLRGADEQRAEPGTDARAPLVLVEAQFLKLRGDEASWPEPLRKLKAGAETNSTLSPEELDTLLGTVNAAQGVSMILAAPRAITLSKQPATVVVAVEDLYPVDWEKDAETGFWKPTKFDRKNLGVTFRVTPEVTADGSLSLQMQPEVIELAGTVDLDLDPKRIVIQPIPLAPHSKLDMVDTRGPIIPKTHRQQPVFHTRTAKVNTNVPPGRTMVLTNLQDEEHFTGEERPPGPLIVLVTARVIAKPGARVVSEVKPSKTGNLELHSDAITMDKMTGKVRVSGNLKLEWPEATTTGQQIEITPKPGAAGDRPPKRGIEIAAAKVIVPVVEIREARLEVAVDYLTHMGIKIVIRDRDRLTAGWITMSLRDIPFSEIMVYLAYLAGGELRSGDSAYTIAAPAAEVESRASAR